MSQFAVSGLGCRRGGRLVFARLDFALEAGDALVLRGPNGSGKSTLLRCLAGLLPPASGEVTWQGAAIAHDWQAHCRRLGYVGHQDGVSLDLSAVENLRFWAAPGGGWSPADALGAFGLGPFADRPARELSAGQRRRLALARLLLRPAPLWLVDEPTAGLDEAAAEAFCDLAARHLEAGGCLVASAHGDLAIPAAQVSLADYAGADEPDPTAGLPPW
jgi:heme exporter protein A